MTDLTVTTDNPLAVILSDPERLNALDTGKLKELMDLQERILDREPKGQFYTSFNAVQSEMRPVQRKARNQHTKSLYARAEDVAAMIDPILTANGFSRSISAENSEQADHMKFVMTLRHNGGHSERHYLDAPVEDKGLKNVVNKTRLQGMASSYTYCERHLLCKVFGVQLSDDDDGNAAAIGPAAEPITEEQGFEIDELLKMTGTDTVKFLDWLKIDKMENIPQSLFNKGLSMLKRKQEKMNDDNK